MSAAAKKPTVETQHRAYVVLHSDAGQSAEPWRMVGTARGSNDKQAIANLISGSDVIASVADVPKEGTFVAVPARSWRPVDRHVQTVQKAIWS